MARRSLTHLWTAIPGCYASTPATRTMASQRRRNSFRLPLLGALLVAAALACGTAEPVQGVAVGASAGVEQASGGTPAGAGGRNTALGGSEIETGGGPPGLGGNEPGTGGAVAGSAGTLPAGEFGFAYRTPEVHQLLCDGVDPPLPQNVSDSDWLCTFDHLGTTGVLYVQATPVSCMFRYSIDTEFVTQAWMSIDGQVTEIASASYDWGTFHHIDFLTLAWNGNVYEYGHSSLTDNRICHPMDCMTVFDEAGTTVLEDGCTADRTLPVVCVPMQLDGSHLDLTDYFVSCEVKETDPAFWCFRSGGAVDTTLCCSAYDDFPETCVSSLSCTCAADASRDVAVCACPEGTCFDGTDCVLDLN